MPPEPSDEAEEVVPTIPGFVAPARTDAGARLARERMRARLFGRTGAPVRLGRYTLLTRLGAGGFGEVYAAHDERLDRRIALKIVHTAMRKPSGVLREARLLARLAHPNVVSVFDASANSLPDGTTELVIAMELVAGRPLQVWLAEQRRSWREVLRVFVQAGRGLAAAHRAGVIHRDFKPANVMLGDDGRARVLDFGIARCHQTATDLEQFDDASASASEGRLTAPGTPAYMAPEAHLGEELDARADQFSFCVALFEALFGRLPHAGTVAGVLRNPAMRWPPTLPDRTRVPGRVTRAVLRGLALDRDDRFADMDALLDQLGVEPGSRTWRIAALAGFASAAAVGWLASPRAVSPCDDAEQLLVGVWDAERARELEQTFAKSRVGHASDTFTRIAGRLDAWRADWLAAYGRACEVRAPAEHRAHGLDRRMRCLRGQLHALAAVTDVLVAADRDGIREAQRTVDGLPTVDACEHPGPDAGLSDPTDPGARDELELVRGQIARALALADAGRHVDALELADHARTRSERLEHPHVRAEADYARGYALSFLLRPAEARAAYEDAATAALELGDDRLVALCARGLVWEQSTLGEFGAAERWAGLGWASLSRMGGDPDIEARLHNAVGSLWFDRRRLDDAIDEYTAGLEIVQRTFGEHDHRAAMYLGNLANVFHVRGDYAEALTRYAAALEIAERSLGPDHPTTTAVRSNYAGALAMVERWPEAEAHARAVVEAHERNFGKDHPELGFSLVALGSAVETRDPALARAHYRRALGLLEAALGGGSLELVPALTRLAQVELRLGLAASARTLLEQARVIQDRALPEPNIDRVFVLSGLVRLARHDGRVEDAVALAHTALREADAAGESSHYLVGAVRSEAGAALLAAGRVAEAIAWLEPAPPLLVERLGRGLDLAILHARLADAYASAGRRAEAEALLPGIRVAAARSEADGRAVLARVALVEAELARGTELPAALERLSVVIADLDPPDRPRAEALLQ